MIKQLMLYESTVWSICSSDNIMRVFKLQKRTCRVILEADTRSNSVKLFKKLERLLFYDEVKLNKCVLVFKRLLGSHPSHMYDILKFNADLHTRTGHYSKLILACFPVSIMKLREGGPLAYLRQGCGTSYPLTYKKRRQQLLLSERPFTDIF